MNSHKTALGWDMLAASHGFESLRELLIQKYVIEQQTCADIGTLLEVKKDRVAQLLRRHEIPLRPRGGVR